MRLVHLLLADLLWVALVVVISARFEVAAAQESAVGAAPPAGPILQGMRTTRE
jgi:hypothetical protein